MMKHWQALALAGALMATSLVTHAQEKSVYRCPGNLYTDALSAKEAIAKGCKTLEGTPITIIQSPVRPAAKSAASGGGSSNSGGDKVSAQDQKARDADARQILDAELRKEEEALAGLRKEYNNGEPERRGDERNFQKYIDRTNELRNAITRKEADLASIRRELSKLGQPSITMSAPPSAPGLK